jgi:hypothetical protein
VKISHDVSFDLTLSLPAKEAIAFVQDAQASLAKADFVARLTVEPLAAQSVVRAYLPVNAALFGQQELPFESVLVPGERGASLRALPLSNAGPAWAEVSGEAKVTPSVGGSRVHYRFDVTIHLKLPEIEHWGGRALSTMIRYTANRVLERVTAELPAAIQAAALEAEAAYARV